MRQAFHSKRPCKPSRRFGIVTCCRIRNCIESLSTMIGGPHGQRRPCWWSSHFIVQLSEWKIRTSSCACSRSISSQWRRIDRVDQLLAGHAALFVTRHHIRRRTDHPRIQQHWLKIAHTVVRANTSQSRDTFGLLQHGRPKLYFGSVLANWLSAESKTVKTKTQTT